MRAVLRLRSGGRQPSACTPRVRLAQTDTPEGASARTGSRCWGGGRDATDHRRPHTTVYALPTLETPPVRRMPAPAGVLRHVVGPVRRERAPGSSWLSALALATFSRTWARDATAQAARTSGIAPVCVRRTRSAPGGGSRAG